MRIFSSDSRKARQRVKARDGEVISGIDRRGGFSVLCSPLSQVRCPAALTKGRLDGQSIMGGNAGTKPHPGTAILEQASRKVNKVGDRQDGKYDKNFMGFQLGRTKIVFLEEVLRISPSDKISRFFGCPPAQHPRSAPLANQVSTAAIPFPFSAKSSPAYS